MQLSVLEARRAKLDARLKSISARIRDLDRQISQIKKRPSRKAVIAEMTRVAEQMGWSLAEVAAQATKPPRKPHIPFAKYRHPKRPELSWSGRGRTPQWVKDAEREGYTRNDLHVLTQADRAGQKNIARLDKIAGRP